MIAATGDDQARARWSIALTARGRLCANANRIRTKGTEPLERAAPFTLVNFLLRRDRISAS
jgi:hypothetical protein